MKKIEPLDRTDKNELIKKGKEPLVIFALRLRDLLIEKNITSAELAKKADCSPGSITAYLNAESAPNAIVLSEIANVFEVSTDYLLGRSEVKSINLTDDLINKHLGLSEGTIDKLKALRVFGEDSDERPLKAFNELMTNKNTSKFFGVLSDYLFGERVIERIGLMFSNNEARKLTKDDKLAKQRNLKGVPKRAIYLETGSTTHLTSLQNLNEKLNKSNLIGLQEMLVHAKKEIDERISE